MSNWSKWWDKISNFMIIKDSINDNNFSLEVLLEQAQADLKNAHDLFARVNAPEMIDYAILNLQAAQKRYDYLLKEFKKQKSEEFNSKLIP